STSASGAPTSSRASGRACPAPSSSAARGSTRSAIRLPTMSVPATTASSSRCSSGTCAPALRRPAASGCAAVASGPRSPPDPGLKAQRPCAYLRDRLRGAAAEGLAPFTLLRETRADWFLRSESRFDEALEVAAVSGISLAPYLVGIENFSQPELDRFNKGIQ